MPAWGRAGAAGTCGAGGSGVASSTGVGSLRAPRLGAAASPNVLPHCPQKRACRGTAEPHWGQGLVLTLDAHHTPIEPKNGGLRSVLRPPPAQFGPVRPVPAPPRGRAQRVESEDAQ